MTIDHAIYDILIIQAAYSVRTAYWRRVCCSVNILTQEYLYLILLYLLLSLYLHSLRYLRLPLFPSPVQSPSSSLFLSSALSQQRKIIKGSLTRDFRLQVFSRKSVSPWPLSMPLGSFRFFRKFAEIIANGCCSATTPAIKEKNFQVFFLNFLWRA
jgi:hypothetical protein